MLRPSRAQRHGVLLAGCALASASAAQAAEPTMKQLADQVAAQEQRLADQERRIAAQAALIEDLRAEQDMTLARLRAGRLPPAPVGIAATPLMIAAAPSAEPDRPVGRAPATDARLQNAEAVPKGLGVLTPPGVVIFEPSLEFSRSSANRLVFRGVEIVPGVQLGVIDATDVDRDSIVGAVGFRFGLGSRLEVSGQAPYVYRHDRITTLTQRDEAITRTTELDVVDWGDLELSARYQISDGRPGRPIFVANAQLKSPTGEGPYDVAYDEFGVATSLATGSGFWGVEGGLTMLYPTDPAVVFASLTYLYNAPRDIDRIVGDVPVGRVDPGDAIGLSLGFGLALNPRFSISLGYSHQYLFATESEYGDTVQRSNTLQVGSLQMGWSYRVSERLSLSSQFEFGVTSDAPDMRVVLRTPYRF